MEGGTGSGLWGWAWWLGKLVWNLDRYLALAWLTDEALSSSSQLELPSG